MSSSWRRLAPHRCVSFAGTLAVCALLAVASGLAAAGSAQAAAPPNLNITITKTSISVGGTLQSGGVNVVSTATGVKEAGVILFRLKPGVTPAEV